MLCKRAAPSLALPYTSRRCLRSVIRYLSPLFPVWLRELPCQLVLHETPCVDFAIGRQPAMLEHLLQVCRPTVTVVPRLHLS
jgi:hypothetical protein